MVLEYGEKNRNIYKMLVGEKKMSEIFFKKSWIKVKLFLLISLKHIKWVTFVKQKDCVFLYEVQ